MTTKTKRFGSGNAAFRNTANRLAAKRRRRDAKLSKNRKRLELSKELTDGPMDVDQLEAAINLVRDEFGIVLDCRLGGGLTVRPKLSQRELLSLCAAVEDGKNVRDRVVAVKRLQKLGFRVSFTEGGPKPSALR